MTQYKCPENPTPYDDNPAEMMTGCGAVFEGSADEEGLVDCPECGMWFTPALEPDTIVTPAPAATPKETPMTNTARKTYSIVVAYDIESDRPLTEGQKRELAEAARQAFDNAYDEGMITDDILYDEELEDYTGSATRATATIGEV